MKKLLSFIIFLLASLLILISVSFSATSYFSNNKALDSTFQKLEKEFLKYERDEVIPLRSMGPVITDKNQPRIQRTSKKITDAQVKEAAQKRLNEIRVEIELKEEELGGLSQQEYKIISDHFEQQLVHLAGSGYGWDFDGKYVSLYLNAYDDDLYNIKGLTGNLARMGKEKDQVDQADLHIKNKIIRYLNQSIQKGNKVSTLVLNQLPDKAEKLFVELGLSKVVAARALAMIHDDIFKPYEEAGKTRYDGSVSTDEIIEIYEYWTEQIQIQRDDDKKKEYFEFSEDAPSNKAIKYITEEIILGKLPEYFTRGFNKTITLDELAMLLFEDKEVNEKIVIEDNIIASDSPDYIKYAFIYGMIDDQKDLDKPLTRLAAARKLINGTIYRKGLSNALRITDAVKIPLSDQVTVSSCITGGMKTRVDKFEPQGNYTREEAIVDRFSFEFDNLRGYNIPLSLSEPTKIIVGKNAINLLFEDGDEIEEYIEDNFDDTVLSKIKTNGSYTKIDTGCALIELFTPETGIKITIKNGSTFIDFKEGFYGPGLAYNIEPKVINSNEKVDMNMQVDSIYKKLYSKLDEILAKIIKPGMTEEQKVKAIHDFVVKHITYDINYLDLHTVESVILTIDKGRGVCGDYSLLFMHLCRRASIPCTIEIGDPSYIDHAWNAVFVNGQWLFVDTTWDDGPNGKVLYTHFLKDRFTFMKGHMPYMGVPDEDFYSDSDIDPMKIKNQDELRAYLLKNFYWIDGFKLTFRMADKNMKPFIGYLWTTKEIQKIELTYDSKNNLYTVTAKAKK